MVFEIPIRARFEPAVLDRCYKHQDSRLETRRYHYLSFFAWSWVVCWRVTFLPPLPLASFVFVLYIICSLNASGILQGINDAVLYCWSPGIHFGRVRKESEIQSYNVTCVLVGLEKCWIGGYKRKSARWAAVYQTSVVRYGFEIRDGAFFGLVGSRSGTCGD